MPTYSYRCAACGFEFERVQRISEDALKDCPQCQKPEARRQITSANFILKGGGWYSDAYSSESNKKSTPPEKAAEGTPAAPSGDAGKTQAAAGADAKGGKEGTSATGSAAPGGAASSAAGAPKPSSPPPNTPSTPAPTK